MPIKKTYIDGEISYIVRLRATKKPREIAEITGRTEGAINRILSLEKKRLNLSYPKLRHGRLKWDKAKVAEWRVKAKTMKQYQIAELDNIKAPFISKKFSMEIHGELLH